MTTTMLMILMALFVLYVTLSVGRLRKLHREASAQLEVNLRMGGEVHQSLTALAGQSAAFGELVARSSGDVQEAIGRVRAAADRILEAEARGAPLAPEWTSEPVAEPLGPELSDRLVAATGALLAAFSDVVQRGTVAREVLCQEVAGQLRLFLDLLQPAQRPSGAVCIFVVLLSALMTAQLDGTLRPLPAEPPSPAPGVSA